ncbi:MAG: GAF domain-containing protein [Labilithrix sp.]|nr:GAF domain-containing protein [Labilithrix sp.]
MNEPSPNLVRGMERLLGAVQELSLARDLQTVMAIVRTVARELTGADGATFVLRDDDKSYYADEDAIAPLWKGRRFPMETCISGWAMLQRQHVAIEDIYADPRVPADAYRPTFVKSLAVVPIRRTAPIGAIGNYWATSHRATEEEIMLLQALADSTSIAMENVELVTGLEARVRTRTAQLEAANRDLEAFSYSVSHDLRAPLRSIDGFSRLLVEDLEGKLDDQARGHVDRITAATTRMADLIDDMLALAKVSRGALHEEAVDLSALARAVVAEQRAYAPERQVDVHVQDDMAAHGDPSLLRAVFDNLLGNAFKFTARRADARIDVGSSDVDGEIVYFVRDNGAGFDMGSADKLFTPFQRLHAADDFPGTGVGLATVQRIVHRHGGTIWPESKLGEGTTFSFTLRRRR